MTGRKDDQGKPRPSLLPPCALAEVIDVLTFGANKYGADNWRNVEASRYLDALMRHVEAYRRLEHADPETGRSHLAHAVCCALFLIELDRDPKPFAHYLQNMPADPSPIKHCVWCGKDDCQQRGAHK